jgi:hypothetical protein
MEKITFNDSPETIDFFTRYGRAMSEWATLECVMGMWFQKAVQHPGPQHFNIGASSIFYSARSFNGRFEMLKAASGSQHLSGEEREFLCAAIKLASKYNSTRSKLAHRAWLGGTKHGVVLHEGDDPFYEKSPIMSEHLDNAAYHFSVLSRTMLYVVAIHGLQPQEGLRRVRLLPKLPTHDADTRLLGGFLALPDEAVRRIPPEFRETPQP